MLADRVVAALATRQHGVVSGAQLRRAGIARNGIAHRVVRFTWRQITGEREAAAARLAVLLARSGAITPGRASAAGLR